MSVQKNKIRKYSSCTNSLNVGIYNQNRLSKVIQIYRERYLYVWQTRKHRVYLLVSFERGPILVIKIYIYMTKNTHMDRHILLPPCPPCFLLTATTHLFLGLLPDITEILLLVLNKAVKEKQSLSALLSWSVFWACAFWRSLWSAAGLRGSSPGGTWCQCGRKPSLFLMKKEKALAA